MSIQKGDFIKISFTAKTANDNRIFDTSDEKIAKENDIYNEKAKYGDMLVIVGERYVVEGFDEDLIGKEVGYKGSVTVPPEKAYGIRNPELIETYPVKNFKEKPVLGQTVVVNGRVGTVIRVIGRTAQIDFNRFLAGQTIIFDYEIKEKVEDIETKVKGLIEYFLYDGIKYNISDKTVNIELNPVDFSTITQIDRKTLANQILIIKEIDEVVFLERHKREIPESKDD